MQRWVWVTLALMGVSFWLGTQTNWLREAPPATPPVEQAKAAPPSEPARAPSQPGPAPVGQNPPDAIAEETQQRSPSAEAKRIGDLAAEDPEAAIHEVEGILAALDPKARSGDWGRAYAAILSLADVQSGAVDTQLYEWSASGNRMIAFPAARALEMRGDPREAERLLKESSQGLAPQNAEEVRFRAANDVARARSPLAVPYLEQAAQDPSPAVRVVAAQALWYVQSPGVVVLARQLMEDPNPEVRSAAKDALGRAGAR